MYIIIVWQHPGYEEDAEVAHALGPFATLEAAEEYDAKLYKAIPRPYNSKITTLLTPQLIEENHGIDNQNAHLR